MLKDAHELLLSIKRAGVKPRSTIFQKTRDDACGLELCGTIKRLALGMAAIRPGRSWAFQVEGKDR